MAADERTRLQGHHWAHYWLAHCGSSSPEMTSQCMTPLGIHVLALTHRGGRGDGAWLQGRHAVAPTPSHSGESRCWGRSPAILRPLCSEESKPAVHEAAQREVPGQAPASPARLTQPTDAREEAILHVQFSGHQRATASKTKQEAPR